MKRLFLICLLLTGLLAAHAQGDSIAQDDARSRQAERALDFLRQNQADSILALLSAELRPVAKREMFEGVMAQVEQMAGAYQGHEPWTAKNLMGTDGYAALLHFETMDLGLFVAFDEQLLLRGLQIIPAAMVSQSPTAETLALPAGAVELDDTLWVTDRVRLPAVITMPAGANAETPIVVMVHGSGALDRDETVMVNKPFRDLAYLLAAQGIATLRYDKRTFVYHTPVDNMDDETIADALCALRTARGMLNKVYLLGHSLGAMLAPAIASRTEIPLQGVIMMAGPARDLEQVVRQQLDYLRPANAPATYEDDALAQLRQHSPHYLQPQNQVAVAQQLALPMLFLQGERDYQVPMIDYRLWRQLLGERSNVTFRSYPKLNHLFLEGDGDSTPLEYSIEGHVPQYVALDIARFCQ